MQSKLFMNDGCELRKMFNLYTGWQSVGIWFRCCELVFKATKDGRIGKVAVGYSR